MSKKEDPVPFGSIIELRRRDSRGGELGIRSPGVGGGDSVRVVDAELCDD